MTRVTIKHLEAMIDRLNTMTNSPSTPWSKNSAGKFRANIGNFHLSQAYGGVGVHRMSNEGGGVSTPIWHGHIPKREAQTQLSAFMSGMSFN